MANGKWQVIDRDEVTVTIYNWGNNKPYESHGEMTSGGSCVKE